MAKWAHPHTPKTCSECDEITTQYAPKPLPSRHPGKVAYTCMVTGNRVNPLTTACFYFHARRATQVPI